MKCPNCNAEVTGRFCEYCGSEMPKEQPNQNITGQNVTVINNYYSTDSQDEEEIEEDIEELLPESKLGIISLVLSIFAILFSFASFGFGILIFISSLICASISLLKTDRKRTCAKITFAIFLFAIFLFLKLI